MFDVDFFKLNALLAQKALCGTAVTAQGCGIHLIFGHESIIPSESLLSIYDTSGGGEKPACDCSTIISGGARKGIHLLFDIA
jgi:hypothetical protein